MNTTIRKGAEGEFAALAALWRRSVEATHHFLDAATVEALHAEVRDVYLGAVELWVLEREGRVLGFMGLGDVEDVEGGACRKVEMLFVEPQKRGGGVGSALLGHARSLYGRLSVDVNEQNPQARGFYEAQGFEVFARSETDGQGRPFPLLHLREKRA